MESHSFSRPVNDVEIASRQAMSSVFLNRVFGWMAGGLGASGVVAWFVLNDQALLQTVASHYMGFIIAELAIVWILSGMLDRISATAAALGFLAYAALNG